MGVDNLACHASWMNLKEGRVMFDDAKLVRHSLRVDVQASSPDLITILLSKRKRRIANSIGILVVTQQLEKSGANLSDGGFSEKQRRKFLAEWFSQARKEFLQEKPGEIRKRHQEAGFILKTDGSKDHLLHFRDVINKLFCLPPSFCETFLLSMRSTCL